MDELTVSEKEQATLKEILQRADNAYNDTCERMRTATGEEYQELDAQAVELADIIRALELVKELHEEPLELE